MRLRPLARRALRTARPPLVFIRSRKPWVRRRLIRLGWNVRFMTADPLFSRCGQPVRSGDRVRGRFRFRGPWVGRRVRTMRGDHTLWNHLSMLDRSWESAGAYPAASGRVNVFPTPIQGAGGPPRAAGRVLLCRQKRGFCRSGPPGLSDRPFADELPTAPESQTSRGPGRLLSDSLSLSTTTYSINLPSRRAGR